MSTEKEAKETLRLRVGSGYRLGQDLAHYEATRKRLERCKWTHFLVDLDQGDGHFAHFDAHAALQIGTPGVDTVIFRVHAMAEHRLNAEDALAEFIEGLKP